MAHTELVHEERDALEVRPPRDIQPSRWWNEANFNLIAAAATLMIIAIPVGMANIYLGYILGESPCTSCSFERFGMVVVGALGLFIMRYGPHWKYVATLAFASFFFLYSTIRHWNYHVVDDLGQGFASAVFGVHTYTWGAFVFWIVMAAVAVALIFVARDFNLHREFSGEIKPIKRFGLFQKIVAIVAIAMTASNAAQMFVLNGPPPFAGKGGPPRTTFNIDQSSKYWTADLWTRVLGTPALLAMSAPMPHIAGDYEKTGIEFSTDPAAAPIAPTAGDLTVSQRTEIAFDVVGDGKGSAAGLAFDESTGLFGLVSTDGGLYYVEDDFSTVVSRGVIDRPNGSDISHTVDATFLGPDNLTAMAWNKTIYGAQRVDPSEVDEMEAWATFVETTDDLMPPTPQRSLLFTARAKEAFSLSLAADPATESYYVVSVPNETQPEIIISQFASDNKLSREGILSVGEGVDLTEGGAVGDFYPVGADFHDGNLYLLSKQFNSLLTVNSDTMEITDVQGLPEMGDFHDIVVSDEGIFVLARDGEQDVIYQIAQ